MKKHECKSIVDIDDIAEGDLEHVLAVFDVRTRSEDDQNRRYQDLLNSLELKRSMATRSGRAN
ncbi:hypothetical protein SAMN04490244_11933 [Tranquillimonas rosea]|uniref:Uncharacterized protein n=1 Tax=Tranquillimonas rosea TaxID=641238 RepID=A0A1H9X6S9_9RHOB|nr:hypothetical protein [Tranquillimonas rosea]SES41761.1 hypothetical protein SAMN04490244_11933 [Tranquillimonas rosea]